MAPPQRPITRRHLLGFGLGTAAAGLLAGCAVPGSTNVNKAALVPAAASGETVQLTYWAWLKDLQKVCDVWNKTHPKIQVSANWIPGGNSGGYQKMYSALAAGGGPDIGQVELRQIPEFMLANGLVDLARYGAKDFQSKYDEAAWAQVSFVDGIYGIPQDTGPMGFYYQTALLEQAGGEPPTTWDEWRDLADKVRSTGKQNYLEVFPVADASPFAAYAQQAGARWFKVDGDEWVVDMTDDKTLMVADFFDGVIDDKLVDTSAGAYSPGGTRPPRAARSPRSPVRAGVTRSSSRCRAARASGRSPRCRSGAPTASARAPSAVRRPRCWRTRSTRGKRSSSSRG